MPVSEEFLNYVLGEMDSIGTVVSRRMFGGVGLYLDGVIFALIANDTLYFKADESNLSDYENAGMSPFRPFGEKSYSMGYYELPIEILENPDTLRDWANKAQAVSRKKARKKGARNRTDKSL